MLKAIKVRIYPNDEQTGYINRQLGCCRFVYNQCLDHRSSLYENSKISMSSGDTIKHIVDLKSEYSFLKDVHSKVLQQSVRDLNQAYDNFFKKKADFPNFKSKKDNKQSCRFPKDTFIGIRGNRIDLIRTLKDIMFKCSRRDEKYLNKRQDYIHNITLTKTASNTFYLSILIDYQPVMKENTGSAIGIDLGVKDFVIDSNGNRYENKRFYTRNERKLKRLNRKLSKRELIKTGEQVFSKKWNKMVDVKRPSHNREKIRLKIAKLNEKIANQRLNYIQQLTTQIVNENQIICIENLNVQGMLKNHKLAKHIQECGFGEFIRTLDYKCRVYGRTLIKVDRFYPSSKTCHNCGYINKNLKLSDREWVCPECGSVIDRDYNAALNILDEGLRIYNSDIVGLSSPEFTPADYPTMDDKDFDPLKSSGRFVSQSKQEKDEIYKNVL